MKRTTYLSLQLSRRRLLMWPLAVLAAALLDTVMPLEAGPKYAWTNFVGQPGENGWTDGSGSAARFSSPSGVTVDGAGNLYVADSGNFTIRKVTPEGVVTTLAGSPWTPGTNDGTGNLAQFAGPTRVAVDPAGNVYVADSGNYTIRKVTPEGVVSTLAGNGTPGHADGVGNAAYFLFLGGVATDSAGNVYVAEWAFPPYGGDIRKVTPEGVVTTLAGDPWEVSEFRDGTGSAARFGGPTHVAVDKLGNLWVADTYGGASKLRKVSPGALVTTVEIPMNYGWRQFGYLGGMAVDKVGNVFVTDEEFQEDFSYKYAIRRMTSAGELTTIGHDDGPGPAAGFGQAAGIAVDNAFNVYVIDAINHCIVKGTAIFPPPMSGTVTVQLGPPESAAGGAKWRVGNGEWLASGQSATNVEVGTRLVEFKPVAGWKSPAAVEVRVIGSHAITNTATYTPVASLNIGEIPIRSVYQGSPAEFRVRSDELGAGATLAMTVNPPVGGASFDPASGVFRFAADATNRQPFDVTFTATMGTNTVTQRVSIQPVPALPPEQTVFGLPPVHPLPSDESTDYLLVNTIIESSNSFNHVLRTTRVITISGKTVVFQQGPANGLHNTYSGNDDIKEMSIHAEKLIVRSPLRLPQTAVTIFAREVRFEGDDASIDTTPRSLTERPAQFAPGAHGLKAGDITIHTERFVSEPFAATRLVLHGGHGQSGGLGRNGTDGVSRSTCGAWLDCPWPANTTAAMWDIGIIAAQFWPSEAVWQSPTDWKPGNGENATPGGKPGNAGRGGSAFGTLTLEAYTSTRGGLAGEGSYYYGGAAGGPRPAYRAAKRPTTVWHVIDTFYSVPGESTSSPSPDILVGTAGTVSSVGHSVSWLSPYALRMVLAHAKDAYLYGHVEVADRILADYEAVVSSYQSFPEWLQMQERWQFDLSEMLLEMQALRHRIASHLDYFCNPAGWVPMLSFEANKAAYEVEIERAVRVMYLSRWIGNAASNVQARLAGLEAVKDQTVAEIESYKALYGTATERIPALQAESSAIAVEEQRRLEDLKWLEERLEARARENVEERHRVPVWKKALGIASIICKAVPVAQPVMGSIGAGFDLIANPPDNAWDTAVAIGGVAAGFSSSQLDATLRNVQTNVNVLDMKVARTGWDKFTADMRNLNALAAPIGEKVGEMEKILKGREAPKNEIEAELAKLKAESPEFQEIVAKLKVLLVRKEQFAQELNLTMQAVTKLAADITHDLLSLDAMNRGVADGNRVLDQRTTAYLKEMDRRARERLLKYQYWMAKAYEYRLLKPYTGELNLTRLFDRMATIAAAATNQNLTATDFDSLKAVYEEQLSTIASGILTDYNSNRPELSAPVRFSLTTNQLAQLNSGQPLTINLHDMGIFPLSEENIRIVDWELEDIQTHAESGVPGIFAFMDLHLEHSGISTLASKEKFYLFRHYSQDTEQRIRWGARYDLVNSIVDPIKPSAASQSLLRSLLGPTSEDLLLFSRPSAWADIVMTKDVYTAGGADIVVDSLQLRLQYDFVRKSTGLAGLEVTASESGIAPYFTVSTNDLNARQDALGDFARTYNKNASVTITAPQDFGEWRFQKWTDWFGNDLPGGQATNAVLSLLLSDNQAIQAHYAYGHANDLDADTMDDEWERQHFGSNTNATMITDHDADGVPDAQEYWSSTDPLLVDSDGDGQTDWQEFIAGTSGNDASSSFAISLAPAPGSPNGLTLSWDTLADRLYRVYASPGLSGAWTNVYASWGDGARKSYTSPGDGPETLFFRVGVELPIGQ